jgi:hypothetical protein
MKKTSTVILAALGLVALGSGCAVEMDAPEQTGSTQEAVWCDNNGATFSVLAGMAVAAAKETTRWLPQRDFECETPYSWEIGVDYVGNKGMPDGVVDVPGKCIRMRSAGWRMWTSPKGRAKCADGYCRNLSALLRLQDVPNGEFVFGGQMFEAGLLKSRLYSYWDRQFICINRPDNGTGDDCPVEYHGLKFDYKALSNVTCDGGWDFWFNAYKAENLAVYPPVYAFTQPLAKPHQLKNMIIWAGGSDNPFLRFENNGNKVKIDPTGGTADGSSTSSGSCTVVSYNASNQKCGQVYSATSLVGQCCTCNNVNKTFASTSYPDMYKCI